MKKSTTPSPEGKGPGLKLPRELKSKLHPVTDIYLPRAKFDTALDILKEIKEKFPNFHVVDYYLSICYMNMGDVPLALKTMIPLGKSNQLNIIQLVQVNMLQGLIYTESEEFDRAEKSFKQALEANPQSSMAHSALGYVYYLLKRFDEAIRNFKKAIELDPNNASAHNNLCFTYSEIGINVGEALVEGRKAVALDPNSAAYHDSLGWAYFAGQDYNSAVKQLQQAFELLPNHPEILDHLEKAKKKIQPRSRNPL